MAVGLETLLKIKALVTGDGAVDRLGQALGRLEGKAAQVKASFKGVVNSDAWQQAAVGAAGLGVAIGYSLTKAIEFDRELADIRKAVDFSDGKQSLSEFSNELVQLSTQLPYTSAELAKIAASAGFAGYAREEIIPFVEDAARMGVAFQMTAEEAGDAMVAMRAAMKLTQPEVRELADAINHLSDRFKGTVSGADLTEVTRRVGAIGIASGLTAEQVAGLGAAFLASGTPAEVAATGLKNFLKALTLGMNTSKADALNWAKLFNVDGAKKDMEAAGFDIAASIAKGMQENPELTMKTVLEKLAALPADQRMSIAGAIFGQESIQSITPILTNLDLLSQAFDLVRDKAAFAGSMQKEFANQMQSSGSQMQIFKNGIDAVAISLGAALLPPLNAMLKALVPILVSVTSFAQKFPILTGGVVALAAALAGLVVAAPFLVSLTTLIGMITAGGAVAAGLATIAGWLGVIGPALGALGGILAGLVSWPVLLVAGLVAAGVALFAFRDQIGAFFTWLGGAITAGMTALGQVFYDLLVQPFIRAWTNMREAVAPFFTWLGGAITAGMTALGQVFYDLLVQPFIRAWTNMRDAVAPFFTWLGGAITAGMTALGQLFTTYLVQPFIRAWTNMGNAARVFLEWLAGAIGNGLNAVAGLLNTYLVQPFLTAWANLRNVALAFFLWLLEAIPAALATVGSLFSTYLVQPFVGAWGRMREAAGAGLKFLRDGWQGFVKWFGELAAGISKVFTTVVVEPLRAAFNVVVETGKTVLRGLLTWMTNAINGVIQLINGVIAGYNALPAPDIGYIPLMKVPKFAEGGFVDGPTLGILGDNRSRREYAVPEEKAVGFANNILAGVRGPGAIPSGTSRGGGGAPVSVNIRTGPVMQAGGQDWVSKADMAQAVSEAVRQTRRMLVNPADRADLGIA